MYLKRQLYINSRILERITNLSKLKVVWISCSAIINLKMDNICFIHFSFALRIIKYYYHNMNPIENIIPIKIFV